MYRIIKVLNNNGILVLDGDTGRELILLGNGIGFGHRTGERLEQVKEAKRYEFVTGKSTALQQVNSIDPVFIEAAGNIIESARKTLGNLVEFLRDPMEEPKMCYCPKCGRSYEITRGNSYRFCPHCGSKTRPLDGDQFW